jgi:hypothetical protein
MAGWLTRRHQIPVTHLTIRRGSAAGAGQFAGNCRSAWPPEPPAENFVEEVAELFSRSDARRIYDAVVGRSRFDGPIPLAQLTENP